MLSRPSSAGWGFALCLIALLALEVMRIYWIMPFPGSQQVFRADIAHWLHRYMWALRLALALPLIWSLWRLLHSGRWKARVGVALGVLLYAAVAYQANGPMAAQVMFQQPHHLDFDSAAAAALPPDALVLGVALIDTQGRATARAYPVRYVGYHHQLRDTVAGQPIMVTYCTVCRSGRVFSPVVDGRVEDFRLVGMDRWNAMFEDAHTGSWWRQANGEAIVGPSKGRHLAEIPSRQMSWASWQALYPDTDVMRADPDFAARYAGMEAFESGTSQSRLTGRDAASWQDKSWVVGVLADDQAMAVDWNDLVRERAINVDIGKLPVIVVLDADERSFHAFDARLSDGSVLRLRPDPDAAGRFRESAGDGVWQASGIAIAGPHAGSQLQHLPAYQEFWHSWRSFRPQTRQHIPAIR